jgi:hypothetical protein
MWARALARTWTQVRARFRALRPSGNTGCGLGALRGRLAAKKKKIGALFVANFTTPPGPSAIGNMAMLMCLHRPLMWRWG